MSCDMYSFFSRSILGSFFDLLAGMVGVEELSGPLGTVSAVNQAVHYGWREVLSLLALLTINVGIFNLLPIPALDGGKIFFLIIDEIAMKLFRKKIPEKYEMAVNTVGFVALMGFMLVVTFNDVFKLFG